MTWTEHTNAAGDRWRVCGDYRINRVPLHGGGADYELWYTAGTADAGAWTYLGRYSALLEAENAVELDAKS